MANRCTLSVSKLGDFKEWLKRDGWIIQEPKGYWEVLRAVKQGRKRPLVVYKRMDTLRGNEIEHYTVEDRDMGVVWAFLKSRKECTTVEGQAIQKFAEILKAKLETLYCPADSDTYYQNGVHSAQSEMRLFIDETVKELGALRIEDKQTPKAVTREATLPTSHTCPRCKNVLDRYEIWGNAQVNMLPNYCPFCGQHLKI